MTGHAFESGAAAPEAKPKVPASAEEPKKEEGPSKNEVKKAAKAAAKDAKRAAYKEEGADAEPGGSEAAAAVAPEEDLVAMSYGDLLVRRSDKKNRSP